MHSIGHSYLSVDLLSDKFPWHLCSQLAGNSEARTRAEAILPRASRYHSVLSAH